MGRQLAILVALIPSVTGCMMAGATAPAPSHPLNCKISVVVARIDGEKSPGEAWDDPTAFETAMLTVCEGLERARGAETSGHVSPRFCKREQLALAPPPDPYLVMSSADEMYEQKTSTWYNTTKPKWQKVFVFPFSKCMQLLVHIYDADKNGDETICEGTMERRGDQETAAFICDKAKLKFDIEDTYDRIDY
jgi:hypothetical protein